MSTQGFPSELSEDFAPYYDNQSSVVQDVVGGTVATVADFGASVWNSIPLTDHVATEDILARTSDNALRVYNENPETIQLASFVGGLLIPSTYALKGMGLLRAGTKGVNWFSEAGQVAQKTKVAEAFADAGLHSSQYNKALYGMYAMGVGNAVVDMAAMEAAIVLTMNAHPYMEDYVKDPLKHFATSMLIGGTIGGGLAHILDRAAVKGIKMGVEREAAELALKDYTAADRIQNLSGSIAVRSNNISNWQNILDSSKELAAVNSAELAGPVRQINNFTKSMLETFIVKERADMVLDFEKMASKEVMELPEASKAAMINMMADNPARFAGIDSIRFANIKEDMPDFVASVKGLVQSTSEKPTKLGQVAKNLVLPLLSQTKKGEDLRTTLIYSKQWDAFMLSSDFKHYSTAVDLVQDEAALTKGLENGWHRLPRFDYSLGSRSSTTAFVDAEYLKALSYYDKLDIKAFKEAVIAVSPDDLPVLNAIHARIQKESIANPTFVNDIQVVLTKEQPRWDLTGTQTIEKVITKTITKTITQTVGGVTSTTTAASGISKNLLDDMTRYLRGPGLTQHDLMSGSNSLSSGARELARSFSQDQMWPLHNGLEIAKRKNAIPQKMLSEEQAMKWGSDSYLRLRKQGIPHAKAMEQVGNETSKLGQFAEELVNSKETRALKDSLRKMGAVDAEGYTYLYRGMRGKAAGHSPGESYTPDYQVALAFAGNSSGVSLYKVHLDEIVGHLGSFGGKKGGEAEIVLDVPTRVVAGKPQVIQGQTSSGHTITEVLSGEDIKTVIKQSATKEESIVGANKIIESLMKGKQDNLISMLKEGIPMETISLHLNIPVDTVKQFAASANKDLNSVGASINYGSASDIGRYLNVDNRGLAVSTDLAKVPFARTKAKLQSQFADIIDGQVKSAMLMGSSSAISRDIGTYLLSDTTQAQLNVLRQELTRITDSGVGNKFVASTDFALRDLGAAGTVMSVMGKDVQELINRNVKAIWEPMRPLFTNISKDPAATVELNTAVRVNAGLKGYREFQGNKFVVQDTVEPWKEILDPNTGKVIGKERNMIPVEYNGRVFEVQTKSVQDALTAMGKAGREMYAMRTSLNNISGRSAINDMGFWIPSLNVRNKVISYVWDKVENKTTLLFGKNAEELAQAEKAFTSGLNPGDLGRRYEIINKSDQAAFNKAQGRHDPVFMASADISQFHKGSSASEIISTNTDVLVDLAQGYDHQIGYSIRSMLDMQLSDVMGHLDNLSYLSQKSFRDQPLNTIQKMIQQPKDPGMLLRHTLLGNSNLDQSIFWQKLSDVTSATVEFGLTTVNTLVEPVLNVGKSFFGKGKTASDEAYMRLVADMDARGIPNPFAKMDEALAKETFHVQSISQSPNMTPRLLALGNATAATFLLRFMELAQPYVNAISLPILTSGAISKKLDKSFMGNAVDPKAKFSVIESMYNGIRYGGHVEGQALVKEAEAMGIFKPMVSEATQTLAATRNLNPGIITTIETKLETGLIDMLSKPADWSETMVRKSAFLTGAYMAKEAYPGIGKSGIITFARNFMDETVGNYTAAQRPIMFQGTLGVAMGLFQTYMVTMAQQMYRQVETKNFAAFAKMMLAQETIFGARSLPGFNYVSEMIGDNFSNQNYDLTTGLYRALPEGVADLVIYGLPSNLGPAITTRGEIQPRIPNVLNNGLNAIPSLAILQQAYQGADRVATAAMTADASTGRAVMEAISLQSVSRPIARMSELLTGTAITSKGNLVAGPDDVWTMRSAASRVMATRPLEEVKRREGIHLNSFYGSLDKEARQEVSNSLKTHIRDNNLTPEVVERLGEKYMRTGSPEGWRSAVNKAMAQTSVPSHVTVRNYLQPNSPYQLLIEDID